MTDKTILTDLGGLWDDAAAILELSITLRDKIKVVREGHKLADNMDNEELIDADAALETIDSALDDLKCSLGDGLDDLSNAVDFDDLETETAA